jgi:hypothetical protein
MTSVPLPTKKWAIRLAFEIFGGNVGGGMFNGFLIGAL